MRMRHDPGKTLDTYFRRLNKVIKDLEGQGYKAKDDLTMAVMLDGLPPEYKSAQTFIESSEDIGYTQAKRILIQQEVALAAKMATSNVVNYINSRSGRQNSKVAAEGWGDHQGLQ
jgi:hypothetical protein